MKIFSFEKWFLDILTKDGQYIILYYTLARFLRFKTCYLDMQIGNSSHLHQKLQVKKRRDHCLWTRQGDLLLKEEGGSLKLSLKDGEFELKLKPHHPLESDLEGLRIPAKGFSHLCWKPLHLKANLSGKLHTADLNQELSGIGYSDYLFTNLSPFKMPVRQLYWGRLHHRDVDLTYAYALDKDQQVLGSWMLLYQQGQRTQLKNLRIHSVKWKLYDPPHLSCPLSFIMDVKGKVRISLSIRHIAPAVTSEFLDNLLDMGRLMQAVLRRIAKNPRGIKFFSLASMEIHTESTTLKLKEIPMIDEYVSFT
jgi:hypothetical protein